MSLVITGGSGFLGRSVVLRLGQRGYTAVQVPRSRDYDLRTEEGVERLYDDFRPEVVIHLAAVVGGIGANRANPGAFFHDNAVMGIRMIEEARHRNLKKFICVGTVCSYPQATPVPFQEDDLWNHYPEATNAPYGLAKKMLLVQMQAYREQYQFNGIYLIPTNLYGPGDHFSSESSHVIPAIIRKMVESKIARNKTVTLWGDGSPTREFLYVEDAADGIVQATLQYDGPLPVNLGSGAEISIRDLAQKIKTLVDYDGEIVWDTSKPNGQMRRCLDTSRAKQLFGFSATTSLDRGLQHTYQWYLQHRYEILAREKS